MDEADVARSKTLVNKGIYETFEALDKLSDTQSHLLKAVKDLRHERQIEQLKHEITDSSV